jgi:uncharacterized hydantoinase/oxoprolinase family protein
MARQMEYIAEALRKIRQRMPEPPQAFVVAGSGAFLARRIVAASGTRVISLDEQLGPQLSEALCAYAVAVLAGQR